MRTGKVQLRPILSNSSIIMGLSSALNWWFSISFTTSASLPMAVWLGDWEEWPPLALTATSKSA